MNLLRRTASRLSELLFLLAACYILAAVAFTTHSLVLAPLQAYILKFISLPDRYYALTVETDQSIKPGVPKFTDWAAYQRRPRNYEDEFDATFMSKAFSSSFSPSEIIPYYYRASENNDRRDITITTLITSNRLRVFERLVERYRGPISVTMHIMNDTAHVQDVLAALHASYASSPLMSQYVDIHLVIDSFDRQFNTWRNIARLFARTDYVMMLDVDFYLCTDFRDAILHSRPLMELLDEGQAAFVVPAFEYASHEDGTDPMKFPDNKESLISLVKSKKIGVFHASWPGGHNSTDYAKFYKAHPGEVYRVTAYQAAYEPYVIFKTDGPPWCDERFVGYGGNKAACLYEMYLSGIDFYVLADHFLIHQNHKYPQTIRKNERKFNRKIYTDFKEETCLRYLKVYHELGVLNGPRGANVVEECRKMKGISSAAARLIGK